MDMGKVKALADAADYKTEADYLVALLSSVATFQEASERAGLSVTGLKKAMNRNHVQAEPKTIMEVTVNKHL